ncbi:MAG: bifunctional adenosylcobinamide kinase/adenosylcobinamide-phosphate guanylyltransferase [Sulfurovaceae bacterium]|nr:bifunctional adenosylcobinamide kinase/adenosylcobinamide-phosphate guanylyltransferase [Sulfurovaceae bacterium]
MKILYFGGQKSGKSRLAEQKTLSLSSTQKPYYLATYDNSYADIEMQERIEKHKLQRGEDFICIEEPLDLTRCIKEKESYLVDCISMWLLNNLNTDEAFLLSQLKALSKIDANIVFVLNDVNSGVIPMDKESRKFVDMTGVIGQYLAKICDEVYEVKLGIGVRLK